MSTSPIITDACESAAHGPAQLQSGDTVRVHVKIKEGEKERIQIFEGIVIKRRPAAELHGSQDELRAGCGTHLPAELEVIEKIDVLRSAKVRRAKLYYLRALRGKAQA